MKKHGYIAISRGIFEHPLFEGQVYSWRDAWQWLIANAAWKPKGKRNKHGVFDLGRGQLAVTEREFAAAWHWPKSSVHRFVQRLVREAMIGIDRERCGPKSEAKNGYARMLVSILNYDKFQGPYKFADRNAERKTDQKTLPLPELTASSALASIYNQENHKAREEVVRGRKDKPRHGARGNGMVWLDYGTPEWKAYAQDHCQFRGITSLIPQSRIGGKGNWFVWLGEMARPKQTRKNRA